MSSTITGSLKADRVKAKKKAKLGITLTVSGLAAPNGTIQVLDKGKKIASFTMAPVHKGEEDPEAAQAQEGQAQAPGGLHRATPQVFGAKSKKITLYIVK